MDEENEESVFEKRINIKPYCACNYLLAFHPKKEEILHLYALEDQRKLIQTPIALLRFGHFGKALGHIALSNDPEAPLFKNMRYAQLTSYTSLEPSKYAFDLYDQEEEKNLLHLKPKPIKKGRLYTFYLIGLGTKEYPYKIVRSIDGPSFLTLQKPSSEAI